MQDEMGRRGPFSQRLETEWRMNFKNGAEEEKETKESCCATFLELIQSIFSERYKTLIAEESNTVRQRRADDISCPFFCK